VHQVVLKVLVKLLGQNRRRHPHLKKEIIRRLETMVNLQKYPDAIKIEAQWGGDKMPNQQSMSRIRALQAKNAQAAGNTGNTTKKWNTTSMPDDAVGARNPKLKTVLQTQANRRTATTDKTATTGKTATTQKGKSPWKNPEGFEAEFQASGTGKAGDTFEAMKTPSKKKKRKLPQSLRSAGKTGKRRARAKARERVIEKNETPGRTKETAKKIGKGIGKGIEKVKKVFKGKKKKPYIEKGRTKPRTKKQATAEEVINPDEFEAMYQASGKKKGK